MELIIGDIVTPRSLNTVSFVFSKDFKGEIVNIKRIPGSLSVLDIAVLEGHVIIHDDSSGRRHTRSRTQLFSAVESFLIVRPKSYTIWN